MNDTPRVSIVPSPRATVVEVIYPAARGRIGLRGSHAPLSWDETAYPVDVTDNKHLFRVYVPPSDRLELKVVRDEDQWAQGRNYVVQSGDSLVLEPAFDTTTTTLVPTETIAAPGGAITFDVLLPLTYLEQDRKHYPVLYVLDGQSLWTTSTDPFGVWRLDLVIDRFSELDAIEEMIIVGIHTTERRMERLSPVPDPQHGGGEASAHLEDLVNVLRPYINEKYRALPDRANTGILGSSMGGLFAFFAAWTHPEIFGKAACLSSSFWWAHRWAVRLAERGPPPNPRPSLYIDSGASIRQDELDVNMRDGFNDTRGMFRALAGYEYAAGVDLHRLVFPGHSHDADSWASRVSLPLQLLFPRR
ncbi:hypothetical protein BH09MYX1_BH09MYX1_02420 [soil metagenome]